MRKMRRAFPALVLIVILVLTMTGCGEKKSQYVGTWNVVGYEWWTGAEEHVTIMVDDLSDTDADEKALKDSLTSISITIEEGDTNGEGSGALQLKSTDLGFSWKEIEDDPGSGIEITWSPVVESYLPTDKILYSESDGYLRFNQYSYSGKNGTFDEGLMYLLLEKQPEQ